MLSGELHIYNIALFLGWSAAILGAWIILRSTLLARRSKPYSWRKRRAALGIALVLVAPVTAHVIMSVPRTLENGWVGAVPTTALVLLADPTSASYSEFRWALASELDVRRHSGFIYGKLLGASADGSWHHSDTQIWGWQERLYTRRLDLSQLIHARESWPEGAIVYVNVSWPLLIGREERVLTLTPLTSGLQESNIPIIASDDIGRLPHVWRDEAHPIGIPVSRVTSLEWDAVLRDKKSGRILARQRISKPYHTVPQLEDVMKPDPAPEIASAISSMTPPEILFQRGGGILIRLDEAEFISAIQADAAMPDAQTDLSSPTFGVRIEIRRNDETIASARAWWRGIRKADGALIAPPHWMQVFIPPEDIDAAALAQSPPDAAWTLRFISYPYTALRDRHSNAYWDGEAVIPVEPPREP